MSGTGSKRITPFKQWGNYVELITTSYTVRPNGCWHFTGYVMPNGYGQLGRNIGAHRLSYQIHVGPVPRGLVLDHACHTRDVTCAGGDSCMHRRCINPAHLEPVTQRTNNHRGRGFTPINAATTHCPEGHAYDEANTYYRRDRVGRLCRQCRREATRRFAEANRASLAWQQRELRRTGVMPTRAEVRAHREEWDGVEYVRDPSNRRRAVRADSIKAAA